jgi:hypothetical protein
MRIVRSASLDQKDVMQLGQRSPKGGKIVDSEEGVGVRIVRRILSMHPSL